MTKERKQEIIETYKREEKDTGSPEVQIGCSAGYYPQCGTDRHHVESPQAGLS